MKKTLNFVLLILSIFFSLFLIETLLRIFNLQPTYSFEKGLFVEDARYGYRFASSVTKFYSQPDFFYTITTNSLGFIGKEPKYNAKYKVLILGDSVGIGQGVAEKKSFCGLAQSYFHAQGLDLDIFNTSVSGYSGINELSVLKHQIKDYKPNLVILIFCWNDVGAEHSLTVQNDYLVLRKDNSVIAFSREWLNNHSRLFCLIKKLCYSKTVISIRESGFSKKDIEKTVGYIKNMKDICDKNPADFVVVIEPYHYIQEPIGTFLNSKSYFIDQLKRNSISFRDWVLILPKNGRQALFFRHDPHLNEEGNRYFSKPFIKIISDAFKLQSF
jgi:hypothetical protein